MYITLHFFFLHKARFSSTVPYFDFDADMDAWSVAKAFAKEPWSREYFDQIRQ